MFPSYYFVAVLVGASHPKYYWYFHIPKDCCDFLVGFKGSFFSFPPLRGEEKGNPSPLLLPTSPSSDVSDVSVLLRYSIEEWIGW